MWYPRAQCLDPPLKSVSHGWICDECVKCRWVAAHVVLPIDYAQHNECRLCDAVTPVPDMRPAMSPLTEARQRGRNVTKGRRLLDDQPAPRKHSRESKKEDAGWMYEFSLCQRCAARCEKGYLL